MSTRVSQGYTILETMIFLAVTSALFVMVVITFQGRQASTEFSVATREMESRIKDIMNDVDTGYYGGTENLACSKNDATGQLVFAAAADEDNRGSSGECIFLGKAIQFGVLDSAKQYNVFSIAGAREIGDSGTLVETYNQTAAAPIPVATQNLTYPTGLVFGGMRTGTGSRSTVAFLSPLNQYAGKRNSSSLNLAQIAALPVPPAPGISALPGLPAAHAHSLSEAEGLIRSMSANFDYHRSLSWDKTPLGTPHVDLCLEGDRVERHVIYRMGNVQRLGEVELIIGEGLCPSEFST